MKYYGNWCKDPKQPKSFIAKMLFVLELSEDVGISNLPKSSATLHFKFKANTVKKEYGNLHMTGYDIGDTIFVHPSIPCQEPAK